MNIDRWFINETKGSLKRLMKNHANSIFVNVDSVTKEPDGIVICLNREDYTGDNDYNIDVLYDALWMEDLNIEYAEDDTPVFVDWNRSLVISICGFYGYQTGHPLQNVLDETVKNGGLNKLYYMGLMESKEVIKKVLEREA